MLDLDMAIAIALAGRGWYSVVDSHHSPLVELTDCNSHSMHQHQVPLTLRVPLPPLVVFLRASRLRIC